jgi:endonuclease YncB( thermonuclease family)
LKKKNLNTIIIIFAIAALFVLACGMAIPNTEPAAQPINTLSTETSAPVEISSQTPVFLPTLELVLPTSTIESIPTFTAAPALSSGHACIAPQQPQTGIVVDVVDGDTIKVRMDGQIFTVRYIGIDTPESTIEKEFFGKEASQKNFEFVNGREVVMYRDKSETDRYDRLLRFVFVGDTFVNFELVNQGFANAKEYKPDTACSDYFSQGEANAMRLGLGFWAAQAFQPTQPAMVGSAVVIVGVNKVDEYVDIANDSVVAIDLTGWALVSERGDQRCKLTGTIASGQTLRIWARSGPGYSCNFSENIWNNSELDPAVLYNAQGIEVSRFP